ncbi:NAD(P)/FAD-dependent oxidoreductase [Candidatus Thalassarchaeum betae]|uniref:NAD(P)/FAD-dependent oxidoreductase n=1 Tax=Candidatus Thalassarchaeum betae TaxID=2599289 RepID=UPI00235D01CC|nr:NAD(P)/FAD-dependent oxidoreductase [Candidatus Thalassoarchaea betae]MCK5868855.1 NAD(P)/FAD-dependent oxidoreductase [Candidatus Thalassarchaeum sp.]NRB12314.1 NAD(P)/FAD-dependent oxidoreductase [Candidatus Thalassarchaeum sp.]
MGEAVSMCDVLVIGAGPGGGNAALQCARQGLSTMLIEDHSAIGTPVHCGECISDLACDNLNLDLPEHVISKRVHGIRVIFPDGTEKCLTEEGYVLEKHLFERWIADKAVEAGASMHLSHKLSSMDRVEEDGRFVGWKCDGKGEQFPIQAKVVIDASGVAAVCSKAVNIDEDTPLNTMGKVVAGMQYELLEVPTDGYLDFYIWPKYAEKGYLWMIPKCDGRANVGLVTEDRPRTKKALDEFIGITHFKELEQVPPPWKEKGNPAFGGTIPISGPFENTHYDGLMLIGDAAGFTSPLFEGGSHLALKSAVYAAETAAAAIAEDDVSAERLAIYAKLWKDEFPPYDKILRGKNALFDLTDDEMSVMARCFPDEMSDMGVSGKAMVGLRLLSRRPGLYLKKVVPAMLAFGYSRAKHYGW